MRHLEFVAAGVLFDRGGLDCPGDVIRGLKPLRPEARDRLAHDPLGARSEVVRFEQLLRPPAALRHWRDSGVCVCVRGLRAAHSPSTAHATLGKSAQGSHTAWLLGSRTLPCRGTVCCRRTT